MSKKINEKMTFDETMDIIEKLMNPNTAKETFSELTESIVDLGDAFMVCSMANMVNDWKTNRDHMMSILPEKTVKRLLEIEKRING